MKMECRRCLMSTDIKSVRINQFGICNYCEMHDNLERMYPQSHVVVNKIIKEIKEKTKTHKYNCIFGISGGCDSSYLLWQLVENGLNPLVVHFDNTWNSPIAEHNILQMTRRLNVDFFRYVVSETYHDLNKAFLYASVTDADIPNDIGLLGLIQKTAIKYKIKYVFNGHNFRTEGTAPTCWTLMDSYYLRDVYEKFYGKPLADFPLLLLKNQFVTGLKGLKNIRLLYNIDYNKKVVKEQLRETFNWLDYGGNHCENIYTQFVGSYLLPIKFRVDKRILYLSAQIRSGYIDKEMARKELSNPPIFDSGFIKMIENRYNMDISEIMKLPPKTFMDYGDYFRKFKKYKLIYYLGMKLGAFPNTYYDKMTKEATLWKK